MSLCYWILGSLPRHHLKIRLFSRSPYFLGVWVRAVSSLLRSVSNPSHLVTSVSTFHHLHFILRVTGSITCLRDKSDCVTSECQPSLHVLLPAVDCSLPYQPLSTHSSRFSNPATESVTPWVRQVLLWLHITLQSVSQTEKLSFFISKPQLFFLKDRNDHSSWRITSQPTLSNWSHVQCAVITFCSYLYCGAFFFFFCCVVIFVSESISTDF